MKPLETLKTKQNPKHNNLFLIKVHKQKQKIEKHLLKSNKKLNTKRGSFQRDGKTILLQLASPPTWNMSIALGLVDLGERPFIITETK